MSGYGYVIIARMNLDTGIRYADSTLDVSEYIGYDFKEWATKHKVKAKLLGLNETEEVAAAKKKLQSIPSMRLRARYNMADGPLLIRTEEPMDWDELDAYIGSLSHEEYAKFVKEAKI